MNALQKHKGFHYGLAESKLEEGPVLEQFRVNSRWGKRKSEHVRI